MAQEREGAVTMRGNPLTLLGPEIRPGDDAPQAAVLAASTTPMAAVNAQG